MRKCTRCNLHSEKEAEAKEAELWQEMVDSLMHFTETSTALMKGMQNKLGIPPDSDLDKKMCDPCGLLEKLKEELGDIKDKVSSVCTCAPESNVDNDNDPDAEIIPSIACYKPPRVIRKKKYKYSSEIESKLLAQKKREPPCQCNKDSGNMAVDACICKNVPEGLQLQDVCDESICPIAVCSALVGENIENIYCAGEIVEELTEEEKLKNDPLAWIRKPGSFDPNKLPQDDSHPYVIKTQDEVQLENHSLGYELLRAMRKFGENIAQIDDSTGVSESYSEYARKCFLVGTKLRSKLSREDIIGICSENHKEIFIPFIAGLFNGNRVVIFDRLADNKQMKHCLQNVTPSIMFASENYLTFLRECMRAINVNFRIVLFGEEENPELDYFESFLVDYDKPMDKFEVEEIGSLDETCLICFNGGIPEPKAVCLSHGALLRQSLRLVSCQHTQPVIMSFLENFQISSLLILFSSILLGATRVIAENFEEDKLWKKVQTYQVNALHLYPYQCTKLGALPEPVEDTSSLIYIFTGGEKLLPCTLTRLKEVLLKTIICQTYEHTELTGVVTCFDFSKPEDSIFCYFRTRSCGRTIDGVMYKVTDVKTGKIVHHMTPGELFVKSKLMRNGYMIKNKEEPGEKEKWISTGDLIYYDIYKCFHHLDRICDLITFRGNKIVPSKLENILLSHPLITSAVVLGIPNEEDGQHASAVVTVREREDIYSTDLEDWMKDKVSEEEQLRGGIKIVSKIPYSHTGKLNRAAICPMDPSKC